MKISKIYLRICSLLFACFLVCGSILRPVVTYASPYDLMIGSSSNALMTLELDDLDYSVMPMSSLGNVTNTVQWDSDTYFYLRYKSKSTGVENSMVLTSNEMIANSDGIHVKATAPEGCYWIGFACYLKWRDLDYLPPSGTYMMSADLSSNFSCVWLNPLLWSLKTIQNASNVSGTFELGPYFEQSSGDFYVSPFIVDVSNCNQATFDVRIRQSEQIENVDFTFKINFTKSSDTPVFEMAGSGISDTSYEDGVSSSLSDLSSSVESMADEISGVTEAIQNLQGAMEPHYNNVLTQLHHITEQLHAFYDQIYNNIHLKEYALWQDIKTAIENIDLEVNVNLDKLKTSIDNMSQAVQNKLQSVSDTITGGYDNSGMESENNELSGAVDELDQAEKEVLDDVSGYIEGFEYPSFDGVSTGIIGALSFLGGFLHSMFLSMGSFGLVITFSLTMIFVLIIVGYHRIRS